MTYTKGQWVRHQGEHGESIFGEVNTPSYCGMLNICDIPYKTGSKGMAKANAALISAAPDLLAACEGLLKALNIAFDRCEGDLLGVAHNDAVDMMALAESAITKAKG